TGLGLTLAGLAFDGGNVSLSVAAVPEPETYALFVAGLLLVGGYARRRRTPDFSSALSRRDTRRDRRA
ncbi:MAG: PEP-CTERM sorting domain-containing protein, partial [Burkholderiales bacterium]|nr:PEP-CTERM sorting domain-containing protein [Burkholderiales bacterium]